MTTPTLADFGQRIVLPPDIPVTGPLGEALVEIVQMARQDRYAPQPDIALIEFKVVAVLILHLVGLNNPEANELADSIWNAVQKEHHA